MIAYEELMCHSLCSTRWASLRIRRGMTVSQALQVSGDWTWGCFAYSERPAPEPPVQLPFCRLDMSLGGDQRQRFASLDEVAQAVDRQMTGQPWRMSLTYLGAMRYSFAVSFDAQGKVQSVSGIWLTQ